MAQFCKNCGNPLKPGYAFCLNCGELAAAKSKTKRGKLIASLAIALAVVILGAAGYFVVIPRLFPPEEPKKTEEPEAQEPETYIAEGEAYLDGGKYKKAAAAFSEAIKLDKKNAETYIGRGDAYAGLEAYEDAAKDYAKAIKYADEGDAEVYGKLADCYIALGDTEKALETLENGAEATGDRELAARAEALASPATPDAPATPAAVTPDTPEPTTDNSAVGGTWTTDTVILNDWLRDGSLFTEITIYWEIGNVTVFGGYSWQRRIISRNGETRDTGFNYELSGTVLYLNPTTNLNVHYTFLQGGEGSFLDSGTEEYFYWEAYVPLDSEISGELERFGLT
ncbi:MAG: tetratricopeptide repeat protein [Oscillospiraceae bacterium]|jgi:tetratricopeptide (TPR) repeat protein|nr:tetratricopeptide repeat protein [Oscillospiraceae bacterium]